MIEWKDNTAQIGRFKVTIGWYLSVSLDGLLSDDLWCQQNFKSEAAAQRGAIKALKKILTDALKEIGETN